MSIIPFDRFACPIDLSSLTQTNTVFSCKQKHSFDQSQKGYVNLLPVQFKKTKDPGDNQEMVLARKSFLETGQYHFIMDTIIDFLSGIVSSHPSEPIYCVDAGCGEGYYLDRFQNLFVRQFPNTPLACLGYDISKEAIKKASARSKTIHWAVATNAHIPVLSQSVDYLFCFFGFPVPSEFYRILKKDGLLFLVDPGEKHLLEIRKKLYLKIKKETPYHLNMDKFPQFKHIKTISRIKQMELLSDTDLFNLIAMTPHIHRASAEKIQTTLRCSFPSITADIRINVLSPTDKS